MQLLVDQVEEDCWASESLGVPGLAMKDTATTPAMAFYSPELLSYATGESASCRDDAVRSIGIC